MKGTWSDFLFICFSHKLFPWCQINFTINGMMAWLVALSVAKPKRFFAKKHLSELPEEVLT